MIRQARSGDADRLTAIAFEAKRHWGYPESMIVLWRDELTFTPEYLATRAVYAAEIDGRMVGVYALGGSGDEREIEHFWVLPECHGRGIGRELFDHAVATTRANGARMIRVVSDPNAEAFYVRMGAKRVGQESSKPEGRQLPVLLLDLHPVQ